MRKFEDKLRQKREEKKFFQNLKNMLTRLLQKLIEFMTRGQYLNNQKKLNEHKNMKKNQNDFEKKKKLKRKELYRFMTRFQIRNDKRSLKRNGWQRS